MTQPIARYLPDGKRLHLQHGPIDLIIGVDGPDRARALSAAVSRFETILQELVDELALLRAPPSAHKPTSATARRMHHAVSPQANTGFVTLMAAVAGAVADEVLAAICNAQDINRAYVNNGGDIAVFLAPGQNFQLAIAGPNNNDLGRISITSSQPIGGVATSGRGGRSLSMGIADSVTVLAASAAAADVAATLIANAVDLAGHPLIRRAPANMVDPDSDLAGRLVVVDCAPLAPDDVDLALENGLAVVRKMKTAGLIYGAALFLQGHCQLLSLPTENLPKRLTEYA